MEVVVVFSYDEFEGYYIEEISNDLDRVKQEWQVDKVIDGNGFDVWKEFVKEMKRPTIKSQNQLAYIQKMVE